jgi:TM2 domain-containing membrane protein YozV
MTKNWYVRRKGRVLGPATSPQLKNLATSGKITRDTEVRLGEDGEWVAASSVQGLWPQPEKTKPITLDVVTRAIAKPRTPLPSLPEAVALTPGPAAGREASSPPSEATRKACMFCGEMIAQTAIKCRHCNEFLDGRPRETPQYAAHWAVPNQAVNHSQGYLQQGYHQPMVAAQSGAVGALLSFFIPGLGQLCTGRPLAGILWFVVTVMGYAFFIVPGLFFHLSCIVDAARVNGSRIG